MFDKLFQFDVAPLNLIVRAVVVYLSILILLRISGKKQMGQMGATEFVAILLISNAVQNSMNGGDNSLIGGLLLAAVLIGLSTVISYLTYKSKLVSAVFEGTPTILVHKGKILHENLKKEMLSLDEVKILLRKQGVEHLSEIQTAIMEADGCLSITKVTDSFSQT